MKVAPRCSVVHNVNVIISRQNASEPTMGLLLNCFGAGRKSPIGGWRPRRPEDPFQPVAAKRPTNRKGIPDRRGRRDTIDVEFRHVSGGIHELASRLKKLGMTRWASDLSRAEKPNW